MPSQRLADLASLTRQPLPLARNRVYRLWRGGALLDRLQGQPDPADRNVPEEWVGSTTVSRLPGRPPDEGLSRIRLPDGGSVALKDLIEAFPEAMLGSAHVAHLGPELGVLCKLLDSAARLPVQCHPSAAFARQHLGSSFGKTEASLILVTRSIDGVSPYMLFGFKDGVTEAEFRRIVEAQDIPAQIDALNRIEVEPGDLYLVGPGMPHALGPGVFMIEVQEPTDLVVTTEYVFCGLQRTEAQCFMGLGFDLGMSCFDYRGTGMTHVAKHRLAPRTLQDDPGGSEEVLIGPEHTPCFGMARLRVQGSVRDRDRGRCYVGIVLEGRGRIHGPAGDMSLQAGSTFFIPAASAYESFQAEGGGPLVVIKCFPPEFR
jgi:mannose-6-phosphate isomerase